MQTHREAWKKICPIRMAGVKDTEYILYSNYSCLGYMCGLYVRDSEPGKENMPYFCTKAREIYEGTENWDSLPQIISDCQAKNKVKSCNECGNSYGHCGLRGAQC